MNSRIFGQQKILNHLDKILNLQKGRDNTIITVEIDMTNVCNSRCPKCSGWFGKKSRDSLSLENARCYIGQLKELGAKALIFTGGGEPTMNPATPKAVKYANDIGLSVGFITNGIYVNDEILESVIKHSDWCRISLDAGSPEMYEETHGVDSYGKVLGNIERYVEAKKKLKVDSTIGVGYLTGEHTIDGMESFVKVSRDLGVDYAQFRPFHWDFTDVVGKLKQLQERYNTEKFEVIGSVHKYSKFKDKVKRPYDKCYGCNFIATIQADGKMAVCCHTRGMKKYELGELKKQSLKEIWRNRQKVFDKIDFKDCLPFCRADEFNRLLFEIKRPKQHIHFL